jgi:hypothetical protein
MPLWLALNLKLADFKRSIKSYIQTKTILKQAATLTPFSPPPFPHPSNHAIAWLKG